MYLQMHYIWLILLCTYTVNSLNLDESHNIDELSEGGPSLKIPDWWFVFQRVTSDGKGSGIYHSQKVRGSFKIGDCHRGYLWMG